ncbi:hypothetical protein [Undibacterium sp.]|uniref:hypothetical protein n=1 Tax=Undibacterium sp. TaxID=1914977 RepID=UPI002731F83A|nr:hypothetical protein [Undibacterium sp.]MDP1978763.1 hypothetical protein [Undibacterium sp.]
MNSLKVSHWQQWEELCCYWLTDIVKRRFGHFTEFKPYGGQGQKQFGIDIVSSGNQVPLVGQCKLMNGSFNLNILEEELKKTNAYKNRIAHFFLLTTGTPHTTIHDLSNYFHERQV